MKNAEEMRKLSEFSRKGIEAAEILSVANKIEVAAAKGQRCVTYELLKDSTLKHLKDQGFKIDFYLHPQTFKITIYVSW